MSSNCCNPILMTISEELRAKIARHPCYSFEGRRQYARMHLPQMSHCQQCRADAIGLLEEDQSYKYRVLKF